MKTKVPITIFLGFGCDIYHISEKLVRVVNLANNQTIKLNQISKFIDLNELETLIEQLSIPKTVEIYHTIEKNIQVEFTNNKIHSTNRISTSIYSISEDEISFPRRL